MADFKLVGAVAIKVRPDASKFRGELQRELRKELAGYKEEIEVKAKVKADTTEMQVDVEKAKKEAEKKKMTLKVGLDYDSVRKAEAQLEAAVKGMDAQKVKVKLDPEGIEKARQDLADIKDNSEIEMTFVPDEKGYKAVLAKIAEIRRQKIEEQIHFGWSEAELAEKEAEMKAALQDSLTMQIHYGNDRDSIKKMLDEVNRELAKIKEITFDTKLDPKSLKTTRKILEAELARTPVELKVNYNDQDSLKATRDRLKSMLNELQAKPLKIGFNEKELQAEIARINAMIDVEVSGATHDTTVRISYNNDRTSIEKAIAEIDAELAKINAVKVDVELKPANLIMKRAELEAALSKIPVTIDVDDNINGYKTAKAKLEALLGIGKFHIKTDVDEASLREQLAIVDAKIKEAEQNALKIKPKISDVDYFKTLLALKLLTKDQVVTVRTRLNASGLLLAAAKLTGLRAAGRWTEEFARSLGTLDRNLPIVAGVTLAISTLTSGVLTLTSSLFSLGNGLGEVMRMAGILAPTMLLGLGASMIILKGVFKDFGAAVNGDKKAIEKLTASGKKAAAEIRVVFQDIRETISKNFWDKAGDAMARFTDVALPAVGKGLGKLSTSLGGIFSRLLDSFTKLTKQGGVKLFFDNMTSGFDHAQNGMADFMDGFNTLAVVGSTVFPRMGRAFDAWAAKFDSWVQRLAADGTLNRWIDRGIQGMKDLFNVGGSLVKVWGNIGQAAQAGGALTLHSLSLALKRLEDVTAGNRFQQNMKTIFAGAREASDTFHKSLGSLGPAMDVFSVTIHNTLVGASRALGAFIRDVGDVISSPKVDKGLTAFLSGLESMFVSLRPAASSIATILQTFGQILGQVATDSGPLFRNLFQQLAGVLSVAWTALEPFLPALIQIGTSIVNILGPALSSAAQSAIPAFAAGVRKIGEGIVPLISFLADAAVNIVNFVSGLQVPTIALMAGVIFSMGGAFKLAGIVVPLATAGVKAFGIAAAWTAIKTQLMVPVIGIALAALTGLAIGGIAALATSQQSSTPYANEYADALREDGKAAGGLANAIGEATTKVALHNLVQSGAYEAAKKLGIGTQEVTDAVLHGGKAWDDIQARIKEAKGAYQDQNAAALAAGEGADRVTGQLGEQSDAAGKLADELTKGKGSIDAAKASNELYAKAARDAGIKTDEETTAQKKLAVQAAETGKNLGAAAAASAALQDTFGSSTSKIDAMRKTFEILLGPNVKQQAAETLGAYVKGFNDLKDTVVPLAQDMKNLGAAAYGEKGFLNVAGGNKAVMQVNQALVDEVNNVWAGAKAAYDAAIKQGDTAAQAFQKSQKFISDHKGDYEALATASGVSADKVRGQWDAVFGHEWVLKVTLSGATEAAARAQEMVTTLKGSFDGKDFVAKLDADPSLALLAIKDPVAAAQAYVNRKWQAKLEALPDAAQKSLRNMINVTDEEWTRGDFEAILKATADQPSLQKALLDINNGVKNPFTARILAALNSGSLLAVQIALNDLTMPRTVAINVAYSASGDVPVARGGQKVFQANGGILDGRGIKQFANGGIERHVAQITKPGGPLRIWAERETQGEAYVPYAMSKRPRSVSILAQVARDFGYTLVKGDSFANGGVTGVTSAPTTHNSASVTIGNLYTTDADEAVRKIRTSQLDALAVAGITLNGA